MAVSGKKNGNFIERSLAGALSFFRDSVFADEYASLNGFMQGWDPRLKVLSILLLILSVQFLKDIRNISILYGVCLLFVVFSKINLPTKPRIITAPKMISARGTVLSINMH